MRKLWWPDSVFLEKQWGLYLNIQQVFVIGKAHIWGTTFWMRLIIPVFLVVSKLAFNVILTPDMIITRGCRWYTVNFPLLSLLTMAFHVWSMVFQLVILLIACVSSDFEQYYTLINNTIAIIGKQDYHPMTTKPLNHYQYCPLIRNWARLWRTSAWCSLAPAWHQGARCDLVMLSTNDCY